MREYLETFLTVITVQDAPQNKKSLTKGLQSFFSNFSSITFSFSSGFFISNYGVDGAILAITVYMLILVVIPWLIFMKKSNYNDS